MGGTIELPHEARELLEGYAESLSGDLEALVGTPVRVALEGAALLEASAAAAEAGGAVHAVLEAKGGGDPLHAVAPSPDAIALGGLLLGQDAEAIREARKSAPDEELLDAFGEVLNMAGALLGRVLAEGVGSAELERGAVQLLGPEGGEFLPPGRYLRVRLALRPEGLDPGRLDLLIPHALASGWWELAGGTDPTRTTAVAGEPGAAEAGAGEEGSLVVFEADPEERDRLEDFSEELGFEVVAYEYADWGEDLVEELAEARAVVVSFDLGGRSGLELIETLAARGELARVALLLADEAPTRALLRAAFRAGAHGFVRKPWRAGEIREAVARARSVLRACLGEEAGSASPEPAGDLPQRDAPGGAAEGGLGEAGSAQPGGAGVSAAGEADSPAADAEAGESAPDASGGESADAPEEAAGTSAG